MGRGKDKKKDATAEADAPPRARATVLALRENPRRAGLTAVAVAAAVLAALGLIARRSRN